MTSHNLLVAVFTASCVALSTASLDNAITLTYPAKVVNSAQGECPSDEQHEMVIAEMKEDICNLLPRFSKWLHLLCMLPNTDSILRWCIAWQAISQARKEKLCAAYCKMTDIWNIQVYIAVHLTAMLLQCGTNYVDLGIIVLFRNLQHLQGTKRMW